MEFAVIRSLLSTARKQGWDILQTLNANPESLIADLRAASRRFSSRTAAHIAAEV
jgi:transposase